MTSRKVVHPLEAKNSTHYAPRICAALSLRAITLTWIGYCSGKCWREK